MRNETYFSFQNFITPWSLVPYTKGYYYMFDNNFFCSENDVSKAILEDLYINALKNLYEK